MVFLRRLFFILIFVLWTSSAFGALVPAIEVDSIDFDGDATKTTVAVGEEVYFSATGTKLDDVAFASSDYLKKARYEWDFGDGYYHRFDPTVTSITRSGVAVTHFYMTPNTEGYTATLSVKVYSGFDPEGLPNALYSLCKGTTIGIGTTKSRVAYGAFSYKIGATRYTLTPDLVGVVPGSSTIPKAKYGAIALDVGADKNVDVVEATGNSTGYTTPALAIAGIPAIDTDHVRIGTITVVNWAPPGFVLGTTEFDAAAVNVSFTPTSNTLIAIYPWTYNIGGTLYTLDQNTLGISPGDDVIPQNKYGAIALEVGSDKTIDVISAADNATGYDTVSTALAGLPVVAENHARMGTIVVKNTLSAYTFGESSLDPSSTGGVTTNDVRVTPVESIPIYSATETETIIVSGVTPIANFEIQHAPFNNRSKQYLYVQIPSAYRGNTYQLKVSLIGATTGTTVLLAPKSNLSEEETVLLDQTSLGIDKYTVRAEILDVSNNRITGGLWEDKFNKTYSGLPTVYIDENNSFRVDGELFFPMSPFMLDNGRFSEYITKASINALNTEGYYTTHTPGTWVDYLSKANASSLMATGPGRGNYEVAPAPNRWKFNHNLDRMADYVNAAKDNPAMFAWIWQDEPNMGGKSEKVYPPTLAAWAYVGHSLDPQHPVYNLFYGYDWSKNYGTAPNYYGYDYLSSAPFFGGKKWTQDIFSFDIYPIWYHLHPSLNMTDMGPYAVYVDTLNRIRSNNKDLIPIIPALQVCREYSTTDDSRTNPGVSEIQVYYEAWVNVIHGAKGITWFQYFDMANTGRWAAMKKFADQMNVLDTTLLRGVSGRTVADTANPSNIHDTAYIGNRVDTMVRTSADGQYLYVVAARVTEPIPIESQKYAGGNACPTNEPVPETGCEPTTLSVTFTISGSSLTATGVVYDESRTVSITDNIFTDTFTANQVHIYQIPLGESTDTTDPVISAFSIPSTSAVLTNSVTFTCTDETSDALFCLSETNSTTNCSWSTTAPTSFTFSEAGTKTLYGFCKDYANNVASANDTITITTTDSTAPTITEFTIDDTINASSVPFEASVTLSCTDAVGVTGYCLSKENTSTNCSWEASAPTVFSFSSYGSQTVYAYCKDDAGNESTDSETVVVYPTTYNVNITAGNGCYLDGNNTESKTVSVEGGNTYSIPIFVDTGYNIVSVSGCGGTWSSSPYVTGSITSNCAVNISCQQSGIQTGVGGVITLNTAGDSKGTMSFGTPPTSSCAATTDYIGNKSIDGSTVTRSKGTSWCQLFTPSCYGQLKSAYIQHGDTSESTAKICVYKDDGDNTPSTGDSKISCSSAITSSSVEWATASMDAANLTSGNYFVCMFINPNATNAFTVDTSGVNSTTFYWGSVAGYYDNPPANFPYSNQTSAGIKSMYVTIGN